MFNFYRSDVKDVTLKSVKRSMYKKRNELLPKSPTNAAEIEKAFENDFVKIQYGLTIRKNKEGCDNIEKQTMFFKTAQECTDFSFCIFSSDEIVKSIENSTVPSERKLFTDATFKVCPKGIFKQLLIIYALIFGQVN